MTESNPSKVSNKFTWIQFLKISVLLVISICLGLYYHFDKERYEVLFLTIVISFFIFTHCSFQSKDKKGKVFVYQSWFIGLTIAIYSVIFSKLSNITKATKENLILQIVLLSLIPLLLIILSITIIKITKGDEE